MPLTSSPETDKIDEALAKARGQYLPIEKGRTADTGKFRYDFADLADVFAATTTALAANGLAMLQDVWVGGDDTPAIFCQTKLMCAGQWYLSSVMELRIAPDSKMSTIQCIGSAETFARRYQAIAMHDTERGGWSTMGWDIDMLRPPVQIGPEIPRAPII